MQMGLFESGNFRLKIIDIEDDAVPAAGLCLSAVGHGFRRSSRTEGRAEHQFQVASIEATWNWCSARPSVLEERRNPCPTAERQSPAAGTASSSMSMIFKRKLPDSKRPICISETTS